MGEIEKIYEEFEPREKMMYHIVDGEFRGWIYKDLGYGVELTSENGYFEIEDDLYNKLEQERIEKNGVIVGRNGELKVVVYPKEFTKPSYDQTLDAVIETGTQEELFKESVRFYSQELEFASKANTELACEIIDQETFDGVKAYMRSIDPYGQPMRAFSAPQRPSIFDKYTK